MATDKELLDLAEKAVPGATPTKDAELEQLAEAATPNGATPLGAREEPAVAEPLQVDQPIAEATAPAAEPAPLVSAPSPAAPPVPPALPGGGRPSMASAGAAIDQAAQAGFDKAAAQEAVGKAKGAALEGAATQADKETALRRQQAVELDATVRAQAEAQQRAQAEAHEAEKSFQDFKLRNYFKSQTAGEQLRANIFIGLGAAGQALAGGDNPALEKLKLIVDQDFKVQQLDLQKRERFAELKQKGATNLATQFQHDLGLLKLKQAAALDAVAAEAKAQAIRNGMPVEAAENNVIVKGMQQASLEERAKGQEHLQSSAATQAMAGAHLALAQQTAEANRGDRNAARADKANTAEDARTVILDGKPRGLVASSRVVKPFEDRAIQYQDSVESLRDLLKQGDVLPFGDAYNRAVLAVAATTTANSSDSTTAHEAATLKRYGLISKEAVQKTLDHQLERQRRFMATLAPIKSGADERLSSAPGDSGNAPANPGKAGASPAKPVDKRALAKEAMLDPDAPPEVKARAREILRARP